MAFSLVSAFCAVLVLTAGSSQGFTVDLIHRDSPLSPLYDPTKTHSERVMDAAHRSISRTNSFKPTSGGAEGVVTAAKGEYLMNISIGTPPVQVQAIADTGSDLIWTQCMPCEDCFDQVDPIFDPTESSTYRDVACESTLCSSLERPSCDSGRQCTYSYSYGDRSYTRGNLGSETVRLGPVSLPRVSFGCGHANGGTFGAAGVGSGIIGLGGGPLSLVSQLGPIAAGKFSYCLVSLDERANKSTSKINFGPDAVVSGDAAVSTPLVRKDPATFYYLTLEGMSVGSNRVAFKTTSNDIDADVEEGNIIIDSGTTLTLLPAEFFGDFIDAVAAAIDAEPTEDGSKTFSLCYSVSEGDDVKFPEITAHFKGADVVLSPANTFIMVREGLVCLAMIRGNGLAIYGNLSQMDFLVGYDTEGGTVSFKPTDCSKE